MGDDNNAEPLTQVLVAIARLEGKVDAMASEHATRIAHQESVTKDLDARLRTAASEKTVEALGGRLSALERKVWTAAGVAAVLATVAGPLVTSLLNN